MSKFVENLPYRCGLLHQIKVILQSFSHDHIIKSVTSKKRISISSYSSAELNLCTSGSIMNGKHCQPLICRRNILYLQVKHFNTDCLP